MTSIPSHSPTKRILLTGVFGPFGVDDDFGRKENIMELFHNQVTKAQGAASFRFFHRSFGLYFLAANVNADVTVLDFPSVERFEQELKKGYDIVGISFIATNFVKAREMARLTRLHAPDSTIIVGGHGAAIEGVEELIDCDHVVRGEGIRWLREHLGEDPDAPLRHPALPSTERQHIYGVPLPGPTASLLVTGVGCVNGCKFCSTSHFFGKAYTPFLTTGREIFDTARRIADERGTDAFFIMDENFLKDRKRAMELLAEMERHKRFFRFHIFSSAEAIEAFGVDNLVRLGVTFVWIGVESKNKKCAYAKNRDVDARELVTELRDHGISVLASGILCAEHHTPENIEEDIDFVVGLNADFAQFMLLTPIPVTALYEEHKARGVLRTDLPYEEWHGQKELAYRHEAFGAGEPEKWINTAFERDFLTNSTSMYRVIDTSVRGYQHLEALPWRDDCLEDRLSQIGAQAREYGTMLPALARFASSVSERERALAMDKELTATFGKPTLKERLSRLAVIALVARWRRHIARKGDGIQPKTILTRFRPTETGTSSSKIPIISICPLKEEAQAMSQAAAMVGGAATTSSMAG